MRLKSKGTPGADGRPNSDQAGLTCEKNEDHRIRADLAMKELLRLRRGTTLAGLSWKVLRDEGRK